MKLGVLFSGGKDSTYSMYLAKKSGEEIMCAITLFSENKDSFMFHTPAINLVEKQAKLMNLPLIKHKTLGKKEKELLDLENAIKAAILRFEIEGIITGAVESNYQAQRIQKICDKLNIKCINPLWHKNQIDLLKELLENNFKIILSGIAAYPLDKKWIGRKIDKEFIEEIKRLAERHKINPAGEGGEYESLVINCPLFKEELKFEIKEVHGEGNAWRAEII